MSPLAIVLRDVIASKDFKLNEIQEKIKKLWIESEITEEEKNELLELAKFNVNTEAERPDWLTTASNLSKRIDLLEARVLALETGGGDIPEPTGIEKWQPWDGISDKYQLGAIVEHNGVIYESVFNGQNVWEPGTAGTEALWKVKE